MSAGAAGPAVFLATRNPGKLREMRRILAEHVPGVRVLGLEDVTAYDEPAETEATFAGNALLKARAAVAATGLPSIADDSGLSVDALGGMPGVLSARWSGGLTAADDRRAVDAANNALLLGQMGDVPDERRAARFVCAVALTVPGGDEVVVHGEMAGRIIGETRGSGGFGYDVLFVPDDQPEGEALTSAEMAAAVKDAISHRGRALREIAPLVARALAG